jgi:hypothetical protein
MSFKDIAPLFIAARILRFVPQGNLTPWVVIRSSDINIMRKGVNSTYI